MEPVFTEKKVALIQSNYIPWKGYFDIINSVDEFIIYDEAQYTIRDWRNRNIIKTRNGQKWLTIPVEIRGRYNQKIRETRIADKKWAIKHWETIRHNYCTARYFEDYADIFEKTYLKCKGFDFLYEVNREFITLLCSILGIKTILTESWNYVIEGNKSERIISICKQTDSTVYYTGPSAKHYIDENLFEKEGIKIIWIDYNCYPEYIQLFPPFTHSVSLVDVIFNNGENSKLFLKSFKENCLTNCKTYKL